jgi:hypothetical protein
MKTNIELSKKTITMISCIAAAAVFAFFLISPLFEKARALSREVSSLDEELAMVRQAIVNAGKSGKQGHLLSRSEVSVAIDEIINTGTRHKINFLSTSPQKIETKKDSKFPVLPIRMEVRSKYNDLGVFLGALEGLAKSIVTVREFSAGRTPEILPQIVTELIIEIHLKEGEGG